MPLTSQNSTRSDWKRRRPNGEKGKNSARTRYFLNETEIIDSIVSVLALKSTPLIKSQLKKEHEASSTKKRDEEKDIF